MNDQHISPNNTPTDDISDFSLGGGVKIVQSEDAIDDVEIESYNDDILTEGGMTEKDRIKILRDKLKQVTREKQEYLDGWQRLKADYVNFKKREEESKGEFIKFAREGLIGDLLPVLESFHMAFSNKEAWEKVEPSWRQGVEYIHAQLEQTLEGHGLSKVDPTGAKFDPASHTAIGGVPTDDPKLDHVIAEVVQYGYLLSGKMIRSPRVKVYELSK